MCKFWQRKNVCTSLSLFLSLVSLNSVVPFQSLRRVSQEFLHSCKATAAAAAADPSVNSSSSSGSGSDVWFIGIHVRRTNYISHLNYTEGGKPVTEEFFGRAITRMEQMLRRDFEEVPQVSKRATTVHEKVSLLKYVFAVRTYDWQEYDLSSLV